MKRILIAVAVAFVAVAVFGILVSRHLDREGVDTRAVVTRVYSREETRTLRGTARRPRYKKVRVYYLDYRFSVDGCAYEQTARRSGNLMTANVGDQVLVRYLPDDPRVSRLVHKEGGDYHLWRKKRSCRR